MKKVLMLATYFPPAGGISTFRITKFVKFLPLFNWQPVVLTVKKEHYEEANFLIDESLMKDVDEKLTIYRTNITATPMLLKFVFSKLPTRWLYPLFKSIRLIINKERPDLMYATGDPFFPLLAAPFAKRITGIKYVIDLRDPWKLAIPDVPPKTLKAKLFNYCNSLLEPIVINGAAKIVVVSEKMATDYRQAYPNKENDDFVVISNGYDPDDYDAIPATTFDEFTVVYAGKFLAGKSYRNPEYFLKAIKILKDKGIRIVFRYVGENNNDILKIVQTLNIKDRFVSTGYLSYTKTIANMKGANLLLLIGNGQETEQTGKIFDYLGSKRPILALAANKGGIADVVKDIDHVNLIPNEDPVKIADILIKAYKNNSPLPVERNNISQYLRKNLCQQLADVFDNIKGK